MAMNLVKQLSKLQFRYCWIMFLAARMRRELKNRTIGIGKRWIQDRRHRYARRFRIL